jgi:hypothetical protein
MNHFDLADVIFGPKVFVAKISSQNADATLPYSRHDPPTGGNVPCLIDTNQQL